MTLYVAPTPEFACLEAGMEICQQTFPVITHQCPQCKCPVRYPLIVSDYDRKTFEQFMRHVDVVLKRHGVLAHLLSEIQAECAIGKMMKSGELE